MLICFIVIIRIMFGFVDDFDGNYDALDIVDACAGGDSCDAPSDAMTVFSIPEEVDLEDDGLMFYYRFKCFCENPWHR